MHINCPSESASESVIDSLRLSIGALSAAHGHRDPYTVRHQQRTAKLAVAVGHQLGLAADRLEVLGLAGLIHDIGKIAVPAEILGKPDALTEAEYAVVKTHCAIGHDILRHLKAPFPLAEIALQHHERLDGSGYPRGLAGDQILLEARILAVVDSFDAMTGTRPYRTGLPVDLVLGELRALAGKLLDAQVVEACQQCILVQGADVSRTLSGSDCNSAVA